MALKGNWIDKINGVDENSADDINQVAHAVIELENSFEASGGGGNVSVNFDEETGEMTITSASGNVKYDDSTGELTIGA